MLRPDPLTEEQYRAAHQAVVWRRPARGRLRLTGSDRVTFLHAMVSHDVLELPEWQGRYATCLTPRGKMIADLFFYKLPGFLLLDLARERLSVVRETLQRHIIMDEVEVADLSSEPDPLELTGPGAASLLGSLGVEEIPEERYQVRGVKCRGGSLLLARKDRYGLPSFDLLGARQPLAAFQSDLLERGKEAGLQPLGREAFEVLRLEAGVPRFGVDMDEKRYPMEAGLEEAISLSKGCYVGQEVVAKATHIGGVANLLVRLRLSPGAPPPAGSRILDEQAKAVGQVTSSAFSLRLQEPIALAYVKRPLARPGTRFRLEEEGRLAVLVESFE